VLKTVVRPSKKHFDASEDLKLVGRWTRMLVESTLMKYSWKVPDVTQYSLSLSYYSGGVFSRSQACEGSLVGLDPKPGTERLMVLVVWLNG